MSAPELPDDDEADELDLLDMTHAPGFYTAGGAQVRAQHIYNTYKHQITGEQFLELLACCTFHCSNMRATAVT